MPAGNGKSAEKTNEHSLNLLSVIQKSIVVVKAAFLCLTHVIIISMTQVNGDPKYKSLTDGYL